MQLVTIPLKMPTVWGVNAGAGFRRQPPNASLIATVAGAASYSDGFVPLNFTPVAAGGVPPFGQDMNGVLYQSTGWLRWAQAGGPIRYDAQFQQQIGGYPAQARVGSVTTPFLIWQSTTDNNLTNPDTGGAGWQTPVFPDPSVSGGPFTAGGLTIAAAPGVNSVGANLAFVGNGNVAPRKWLRVLGGNFAVINNAYNAEIFTLTDAGDIVNVRDVTMAGSLVSAGGIYAGTFFTPNAYNGYEWQFTVNPDGSKVQAYRAGGWYDLWNSSNGTRSWNGPAGALMVLDGAGNLDVTGQITAHNNIRTTTSLTIDYNGFSGSEFTIYRGTNTTGEQIRTTQYARSSTIDLVRSFGWNANRDSYQWSVGNQPTYIGMELLNNGSLNLTGTVNPAKGMLTGAISNPIGNGTNGFQVLENGTTQIFNDTFTTLSVGNRSLVTPGVGPLVAFYWNNTYVGGITTNSAGVSYNSASDYRLKTISGPADAGAMIDAIPVYEAVYTSHATGQPRPMFLAHDVQPWIADAVIGEKDAVDADGKPVYQMMDHAMLIAALWAETKSIRARLLAANI